MQAEQAQNAWSQSANLQQPAESEQAKRPAAQVAVVHERTPLGTDTRRVQLLERDEGEKNTYDVNDYVQRQLEAFESGEGATAHRVTFEGNSAEISFQGEEPGSLAGEHPRSISTLLSVPGSRELEAAQHVWTCLAHNEVTSRACKMALPVLYSEVAFIEARARDCYDAESKSRRRGRAPSTGSFLATLRAKKGASCGTLMKESEWLAAKLANNETNPDDWTDAQMDGLFASLLD